LVCGDLLGGAAQTAGGPLMIGDFVDDAVLEGVAWMKLVDDSGPEQLVSVGILVREDGGFCGVGGVLQVHLGTLLLAFFGFRPFRLGTVDSGLFGP